MKFYFQKIIHSRLFAEYNCDFILFLVKSKRPFLMIFTYDVHLLDNNQSALE